MDEVFSLGGRSVVVTGGKGQLGVEFSLEICRRKGRVVVIDPAIEPKVKQGDYYRARSEGRLVEYNADITDEAALRDIAEQIETKHGVPHGLVNCAAIDTPPDTEGTGTGPFETFPVDLFRRVMDVNVTGTLLCCQIFGSRMAEEGRGSIVNLSSVYGLLSPCQDIYNYRRRQGDEFYKPVSYSVSKSAVLNLTRYLATYWAEKNVRVNTLTLSGIFNNQDEEFLKAYNSRTPIRRMANAEETSGSLIYLLSDASSYTTGANLVVDGGWSSW